MTQLRRIKTAWSSGKWTAIFCVMLSTGNFFPLYSNSWAPWHSRFLFFQSFSFINKTIQSWFIMLWFNLSFLLRKFSAIYEHKLFHINILVQRRVCFSEKATSNSPFKCNYSGRKFANKTKTVSCVLYKRNGINKAKRKRVHDNWSIEIQ